MRIIDAAQAARESIEDYWRRQHQDVCSAEARYGLSDTISRSIREILRHIGQTARELENFSAEDFEFGDGSRGRSSGVTFYDPASSLECAVVLEGRKAGDIRSSAPQFVEIPGAMWNIDGGIRDHLTKDVGEFIELFIFAQRLMSEIDSYNKIKTVLEEQGLDLDNPDPFREVVQTRATPQYMSEDIVVPELHRREE